MKEEIIYMEANKALQFHCGNLEWANDFILLDLSIIIQKVR